jgi:alkyl sulfatase BDS1-like metallo-beta-lactamase superfamily hydrolase
VVAGTAAAIPPDFIVNLSTEQLFDVLAIQIDGPRAGDRDIALHWRLPDTADDFGLTLQDGVLTHRRGAPDGHVDATVTVERSALNDAIAGAATIDELMGARWLAVEGDRGKLDELLGLLHPPDPTFAIVTPLTDRRRRQSVAPASTWRGDTAAAMPAQQKVVDARLHPASRTACGH